MVLRAEFFRDAEANEHARMSSDRIPGEDLKGSSRLHIFPRLDESFGGVIVVKRFYAGDAFTFAPRQQSLFGKHFAVVQRSPSSGKFRLKPFLHGVNNGGFAGKPRRRRLFWNAAKFLQVRDHRKRRRPFRRAKGKVPLIGPFMFKPPLRNDGTRRTLASVSRQ